MATTKRIRKSVPTINKADRAVHSGRASALSPQSKASLANGGRRSLTTISERTPLKASKRASKGEAGARRQSRLRQPDGAGQSFRAGSKGAIIVGLLGQRGGATITELTEATGWQAHSVRGFLSGFLKKKRGVAIASETGEDGKRRYRIAT